MNPPLSRRHALTGAASLGVGVPLLAACGDDAPTATDDATPSAPSSEPSPTSPEPAPESTDAGTGSGEPAGDGLVSTADVPVGGGVVLGSEEIVVTQPTEGEFKAFSAICTHQGCLVGGVEDGEITCPCHASMFDINDGSVLGGLASSPLPAVAVTVQGNQVVRS